MNIHDFSKMKKNKEKISMVTCYDHWTAQIIDKSNVDAVLIGDSAAMVVYGKPNTLDISTDQMALLTTAVSKGASSKFIISDMPFLSYRKNLINTMNNVEKLMQAGASAIKLEGALGNLKTIRHIVESGVPVMGHLGLTPQMFHQLGGYKVQGKEENQAQKIIKWAQQLQEAGCFSLVLECVPITLAQQITKELEIPSIGIGAGSGTDGQILVLQDMLGVFDKNAKFVRTFNNLSQSIGDSLNQYDKEVKTLSYPNKEESYS